MQRAFDWAGRHWRPLLLAAWLLAAGLMVWSRWQNIYWFALADTDDNMRIMQVRALLAGQDWYDLRQYRMDPPFGGDIHWSRIVDLPIAVLRLLFGLGMDGPSAERAAVAVAPLLPMGVALTGLSLIVRRLLGPPAFLLVIPLFFFGASLLSQFMPTRIDHHGWQLAMLSLLVAGLVDPRQGRGGVTAAAASAVSLSIGLEFLPYLAAGAGIVTLYWVRDAQQQRRLALYGVTLAGGSALGFALFASIANRAPVCDALSPVWLSAALAGGAILYGLSRLAPPTWQRRLLVAVIAAVLLAGAFALVWPHCLGQPEGASAELRRIWLDNVREAKPLWQQSRSLALGTLSLPVSGLAGSLLLLWTSRRDAEAWPRAAAVAFFSVASLSLLAWQTRAGPGAQLLSLPGATALACLLLPRLRASRSVLVRVAGPVLIVIAASGAIVPVAMRWFNEPAAKPGGKRINLANRRCPTIPAMRPIAQLPPGLVFTFVDLGPRLIALTRHSAVTGPYHRNGQAIEDVMHAFRGSEALARQLVLKRRADYLLICPDFSESTLYSSGAPKGFYMQLRAGRVPAWLSPVPLPKDSPFKMWRVVR